MAKFLEQYNKKKLIILGAVAVIIVAIIIGVIVAATRKKAPPAKKGAAKGAAKPAPKKKFVESLCDPADYKVNCKETLSSASGITGDPGDVIRGLFDLARDGLRYAIENATSLQHAFNDHMVVQAFQTCEQLLDFSIDDLQKCEALDFSNLGARAADLKTWLSAAITFQHTCLDGFDGTTVEDARKMMEEQLQTAEELTSNGLALVTQLYKTDQPASKKKAGSGRRLLSDGYPSWVGYAQRRLLQASPAAIKPNVVVAKDGSGKYSTINDALKEVPLRSNETFVIYIKAGVYPEIVELNKLMWNVMLIGDGPTKTKITGGRSYVGGFNTFNTATLGADGEGLILKDIGIENSAGATMHQAVALRVSGDMSVVHNCQIDGYQDTLYAHAHRQFYRDCTVSGTIDFIFGDSAAVLQNCNLVVRKPMDNQACMVTAQGRTEQRQTTGLVLQNCIITAEPALLASPTPAKVYLGRPWKNFSRTVIMNSEIGGFVDPEGWSRWDGDMYLDTLWYAEYNNRGPGSVDASRVRWPGIKKITTELANGFTPKNFIQADDWIPHTGVPYDSGLTNV